MGMPSLVVVRFGENQVHFRRQNGSPEAVGIHLLDMLESADSIKPRAHFHTGSYFLRFIFQAGYGDEPISPKMRDVLPIYEAIALDDNVMGDWEFAYEFSANPAGNWTVSYAEDCDGERWSELAGAAEKLTPEQLRDRLDSAH